MIINRGAAQAREHFSALRAEAAKESVWNWTYWRASLLERIIYDASEETGGNKIAAAVTGANVVGAEIPDLDDRIDLAIRGVGDAAVVATTVTAIGDVAVGALKGSKGLGTNPFKGKSPQAIDQMFKDKGFEPRGPDPVGGKGGYVNPKTGRSYHIDPEPQEFKAGTELPHVDVNRPKNYGGSLEKRKYPLGSKLND